MDEILASIRRIIADEEGADAVPAATVEIHSAQDEDRVVPVHPVVTPVARPSETVFDRHEPRAPLRPVTPAPPPYRAPDVGAVSSRASASVVHHAPAAHRPRDLLAPDAEAAVAAAFDQLGACVVPAQQRTVEDLMKEMLRPMLKNWLDDNLPRLVEGLVRQEIERVTRARR